MAEDTTNSETTPATPEAVSSVEKAESNFLKGSFNTKRILTFSGLIALTIAGAFLIRAYLDLLRIEQLKKELDQKK